MAGRETDFRKPASIREKMTGAAADGFDSNYSLLDVEESHAHHPSLRLCGVLVTLYHFHFQLSLTHSLTHSLILSLKHLVIC